MKPGALFYAGVLGYSSQNNDVQKALLMVIRSGTLRSVLLVYRLAQWALLTRLASPSTYMFPSDPNDFYRSSQEAVMEVLLEGFVFLHLKCMLEPVRIIGVAKKPARNEV